MSKGKLIILTGLPASGKDSVMNRLLDIKPEIHKIVSHTNRPMRQGERDKFDHYFVSTEEFEELISMNYFLEYVKTGPYYKGTSKPAFEPVLQEMDVIWRIDIFRAATLEDTFKQKFGNAKAKAILERTVKIMIKPAGYKESLLRFKARNAESTVEEFHQRYIKEVEIFNKNKHRFPVLLDNNEGDLQQTVDKVIDLINAS